MTHQNDISYTHQNDIAHQNDISWGVSSWLTSLFQVPKVLGQNSAWLPWSKICTSTWWNIWAGLGMQVKSQSKIGIGFVRSYASWELAYQGQRPWKLSSLEEQKHSGNNKDLLKVSIKSRLILFNFRGKNPETHPENISKYMAAIKTEFADYQKLTVHDVRNQVGWCS